MSGTTVKSVLDFSPIGSDFKSHPIEKANSPYLTMLSRISSQSLSLRGTQLVVISHPTTSTTRAADAYHLMDDGTYVFRDTISYNHDLESTSIRKSVISYTNSIQCPSITASNLIVSGAVNSTATSTTLAESLSAIKNVTPTTLSNLTFPFDSSDVLRFNNNRSYQSRSLPVAGGVCNVMVYPDDILSDIRTEVKLYDINNGAGSGMRSVDFTDISQEVYNSDLVPAISTTTVDVPVTLKTPWIPYSMGDGMFISGKFSAFLSLGGGGVATPMFGVKIYLTYRDLIGGTTVKTLSSLPDSPDTSNAAKVLQCPFSDFMFSPDRGMDGFVQVSLELTPHFTSVLAAPMTVNALVSLAQPARKHLGDGPGTIIHFLSGGYVGQQITFNTTQVVLHEPEATVMTGYSPTTLKYDPALNFALRTITQNLSANNLSSFMALSDFPDFYERFTDLLFITRLTYICDQDSEDYDKTSKRIMEAVDMIDRKHQNIPHASLKSFFKKAGKWLKKNVWNPVVKPAVTPFYNLGKRLGQIGLNVLEGTADNIGNNVEMLASPQGLQNVLGSAINESTGLPLYRPVPVADTGTTTIYKAYPGDYLAYDRFKRRASTRDFANELVKTSDRYYKANPSEDLSTRETQYPTCFVKYDSVCVFPVIYESRYDRADMFSGVVGAALYGVMYLDDVPSQCCRTMPSEKFVFNHVYDEKGFKPARAMILMKLLSVKNDKVEVSQPSCPVEDRSWELAAWMLEHGFGGIHYCYSGAIEGGNIIKLSPDVAALKKSVAKRAGMTFVANTNIANVQVESLAKVYPSILAFGKTRLASTYPLMNINIPKQPSLAYYTPQKQHNLEEEVTMEVVDIEDCVPPLQKKQRTEEISNILNFSGKKDKAYFNNLKHTTLKYFDRFPQAEITEPVVVSQVFTTTKNDIVNWAFSKDDLPCDKILSIDGVPFYASFTDPCKIKISPTKDCKNPRTIFLKYAAQPLDCAFIMDKFLTEEIYPVASTKPDFKERRKQIKAARRACTEPFLNEPIPRAFVAKDPNEAGFVHFLAKLNEMSKQALTAEDGKVSKGYSTGKLSNLAATKVDKEKAAKVREYSVHYELSKGLASFRVYNSTFLKHYFRFDTKSFLATYPEDKERPNLVNFAKLLAQLTYSYDPSLIYSLGTDKITSLKEVFVKGMDSQEGAVAFRTVLFATLEEFRKQQINWALST